MAERLELEDARRSGELVDISCVRDSVAEDYVIARTQLSAIGSKLAPRLVGQRDALGDQGHDRSRGYAHTGGVVRRRRL